MTERDDLECYTVRSYSVGSTLAGATLIYQGNSPRAWMTA